MALGHVSQNGESCDLEALLAGKIERFVLEAILK